VNFHDAQDFSYNPYGLRNGIRDGGRKREFLEKESIGKKEEKEGEKESEGACFFC
jgi:hypothetical protein